MRSFNYMLIFALCVGGCEYTTDTIAVSDTTPVSVPAMVPQRHEHNPPVLVSPDPIAPQLPVYLRQPVPRPECDDYRCVH